MLPSLPFSIWTRSSPLNFEQVNTLNCECENENENENGWSRQESEKSRVSRKSLSTQNRKAIIKAWGGRCGSCRCEITKERYEDLSENYMCDIDHFIPLRHGGENDYNNLWPICGNCHRYKSTQESKMIYGKSRNYCVLCKNWGSHVSCLKKNKDKFFNLKIFNIYRTDDNYLENYDYSSPIKAILKTNSDSDSEQSRFKKYEYSGN